MKIIVKHKDLDNVSKNMISNKEDFDKNINSCLEAVESIGNVWQGEEANYSLSIIRAYLNNLKNFSNAYSNLGNFIKYANEQFYIEDKGYKDYFDRERRDYESEYDDV